ncbi:hypothetical protein C8R42DRAFT_640081 [Lentinula raphanica]|nr:hypothetical protein C8R42DRAFT_640081 [Lentinula raphanica]
MFGPSTVRLSYANYCLHPDLLTRFSDPGSVLQPFDGRVGAILKSNHLVTSPNSDVLFAPPLGPRRVRLRRDLHFSHDDPLFYPQPFDELRPHLPLIRAASNDPKHPFAAAWASPSEKDFEEAGDILYGACILDNDFYLRIKSLAHTVLQAAYTNDNDLDGYLEQGALQVEHARTRYRCQQWTASSQDTQTPVPLDVVGAFTDNLSTLDILYYLGIPVWYARPVQNTPDARIDRSTYVIAEDQSKLFTLPSGFQVDGSDAIPEHKVVWEGLPNKSERYSAMNAYLSALLYPSSLFGSSQLPGISSSQRALVTRASCEAPSFANSDGMVNSHCPNARSKVFTPYSQHKRKKPQSNTRQKTNMFIDVDTPSMSSVIPAWSRALSLHSSYEQSQSYNTVDSGYFLPPPRLIDGPKNPVTRAFYYRSWLKARPLILQNLTGSRAPVKLSAKRWRCFLDVVGGHPVDLDSGNSEPTKNSIYRAEMQPFLQNLIIKTDSRSFASNMDDPVARIEYFYGQPVDCRIEPPPTDIASQILWEISEISFRQELAALDRHLDESGLPLAQRDSLVDLCWLGSRCRVDITRSDEGLAAPDIQKRAPYIRSLHQLMTSWRGDKPEELYFSFPDATEDNFTLRLAKIEQSLANFYTTSYLSIFARAPSIPHILNV